MKEAENENLIKRAWNGKLRLFSAYWGLGFLGNIAMTLIAATTSILGSSRFTLITDFSFYIYSLFCLVAIWRSAKNYQGRKTWRMLAKISVVIGGALIIINIATILVSVYPAHKPRSYSEADPRTKAASAPSGSQMAPSLGAQITLSPSKQTTPLSDAQTTFSSEINSEDILVTCSNPSKFSEKDYRDRPFYASPMKIYRIRPRSDDVGFWKSIELLDPENPDYLNSYAVNSTMLTDFHSADDYFHYDAFIRAQTIRLTTTLGYGEGDILQEGILDRASGKLYYGASGINVEGPQYDCKGATLEEVDLIIETYNANLASSISTYESQRVF